MNTVAMAFLNSVGASTGPLYATGLRRAAQALAGATETTPAAQAALLKGLADGVRERGKGQRGDKTMLDALMPAAEAAANAVRQSASDEEMWREIIAAAEAGAASTRSMVALKGRAARLGERALGHIDPGAASAVVILKAMALTFRGSDPDKVTVTSERGGQSVRKSESSSENLQGGEGLIALFRSALARRRPYAPRVCGQSTVHLSDCIVRPLSARSSRAGPSAPT